MLYGNRSKRPVQGDYYYLGLHDAAAFHAILAISAKHLDQMRGLRTSAKALIHATTSIRLINDRLGGPHPERDDAILFATVYFAIAERRFGDVNTSRLHWLGLKALLDARGGLPSTSNNQTLENLLVWNNLVYSGWKSKDKDPLTSSAWPSLIASSNFTDFQTACEEFSAFMQALPDIAYAHQWYWRLQNYRFQRSALAPGGIIDQFFHTNQQSSATGASGRAFSQCQMPTLLYLNMVLRDYANDPRSFEGFKAKVLRCIEEENLARSGSLEQVLMRLLMGVEGSADQRSARAYKVTRLTDVAKMLGEASWQQVQTTLRMTLAVAEGWKSEQCLPQWNADLFISEMIAYLETTT